MKLGNKVSIPTALETAGSCVHCSYLDMRVQMWETASPALPGTGAFGPGQCLQTRTSVGTRLAM